MGQSSCRVLGATNFEFDNPGYNHEERNLGIRITFENAIHDASAKGKIRFDFQSESRGKAELVARRVFQAVLLLGFKNGNGSHVGAMGPDFGLADGIVSPFEKALGLPLILPEAFGLNFLPEHAPGAKWISVGMGNSSLIVSSKEAAYECVRFLDLPEMSKKLFSALEVWNFTHFLPKSMARFLLNMTALECLIERNGTNPQVVDWIDKSVLEINDLEITKEEKQKIKQRFFELKQESISFSGRLMFRSIFGSMVEDMEPGRYFNHIYDIRSKLVHDGVYEAHKIPVDFEETVKTVLENRVLQELPNI